MNKAIHRTVRKLKPLDEGSPNGTIGPFSQYFEVPNIILLGDPGSGKTHTFKAAAEEEKAEFKTVRQFLATEGRGCEGKTVYLDGLDEFRSRIQDKNSVIEVIKYLGRIGQPRFRLSCRVADWLGETDLSLFQVNFGESQYVVLHLEPLNKDEVATILRKQGIIKTEDFVNEAERRGIEGLLANPQTLLMLSDIVRRRGNWPETKLDLYESSIPILLLETNQARMGPGLGKYRPEELIDPAGAACASILISGVEGISLLESEMEDDFPTYRSVPFDDLEMVQASLTRRAFSVVGFEQQAVSYIHRTTAEFMAAKWLASQIRNGLPIRRVQNLIGIEGHPAPDLRGLHSWLATVLPEYASIFIRNDPYGVLMYGDPAVLSPDNRQLLLSSLEILSHTDPWFRSSDWSDRPLGALSGPDMVEAFQRILFDKDSSFQLRNLVLDSIRNGPPLPQMGADLRKILEDPTAIYRDRIAALYALLRVIPDGEREVIEVYRSVLMDDPSSVHLRAKILSRLYSRHFGPADVVSIFKDILSDTEEHAVGELWELANSIPTEELPDILDNLCDLQCKKDISVRRPNEFEVESAFSQMLVRFLNSEFSKQTERIWRWLKALHSFNYRGYSGSRKDDIRDWLINNQEMVYSIFEIALDEFDYGEKRSRLFLYDFQKASMNSIKYEDLLRYAFEILKSKSIINEKDCFLYKMCGQIIFSLEITPRDIFEEFYLFADKHQQLQRIRENCCQWEIEDWRKEDNIRRIEDTRKREKIRKESRANLEKTRESIRAGTHLQNLGFLSRIYFGQFIDVDRELNPVERLRIEIGEDLLIDALEGFSAVIKRTDFPSPIDVASLLAEGRYSTWWYAVLAGMDEAWQKLGSLDIFPGPLLKSALAIAIELRTTQRDGNVERETIREWKDRLFIERPDIVESVFEDMARVWLKSDKKHISVLPDLVYNEMTKTWRGSLALRLLREYSFPSTENLKYLVIAATYDPLCHRELIRLAIVNISTHMSVEEEVRAIWLILGFLLNEKYFLTPLLSYAESRDFVVWNIRDFINEIRVSDSDKPIKLSVNQLEVIIKLAGEKFENVSHPRSGWSGDRNLWDASEFVQRLINLLSAESDLNAYLALKRLLDNVQLKEYHDHLRHARASQAIIRRQAEYFQPSWSETVEVLRGGKPANIADLHALILDCIETFKIEIRLSNTDTYKAFWRCNSWGAVESPEIEDICRDRLIELLKQRLIPLGIRAEPEGHMVADKRADIVVLPPPGQKLPLELKRDTHEDLWEACINQLERMYTRDPEAAGYGIYGVFWFGDKRRGRVPRPPEGISPPISAEELETALQSLIPEDKQHCLEAVVIDVSPPL